MAGWRVYESGEVWDARMAYLHAVDLAVLAAGFQGTGSDLSECAVTRDGLNTVAVAAGTPRIDGTLVVHAASAATALPAAHATHPKWCLIEIDAAGATQTNDGTAGPAPVPPTPSVGSVVVAKVWIEDNATDVDTLLTSNNGKSKLMDMRVEPTASSQVDVQLFTTPGTPTWSKPAGAQYVRVLAVGAGGGAGSGARGNNSTAPAGGGGAGGPGGVSEMWIPAANLNATEQVTVGAGGVGGVAKATNGAGNDGTAGGQSQFGTNARNFCFAGGGSPGLGGTTTTAAAGGLSGSGTVVGAGSPARVGVGATWTVGGRKGGAGAAPTGAVPAVAGSSDQQGPGAGGGGGGNTSGGVLIAAANGGNGPSIGQAVAGTLGGVVANASAGTAGVAGAGQTAPWNNMLVGGGGGSGGNGRNGSGNGGQGGAGAAFGAGGGGGGNGISSGSSGAGGVGGGGAVLVVTFFGP
jgi:hypothetical protein